MKGEGFRTLPFFYASANKSIDQVLGTCYSHGVRTCVRCKTKFEREDGYRGTRCLSCRQRSRDKACRKCRCLFRDESLKNTRRFCDACTASPPKGLRRSPTLERTRRTQRGDLSRLSSLKPFSATWWGRVGELLYLQLFPSACDVVASHGAKAPFDCLGEGRRVNVKTAKQSWSKAGKPQWKFQLGGSSSCDEFFLIGFDETRKEIRRAWRASSSELPSKLQVLSPSSREYMGRAWEVSPGEVMVMGRHLQKMLQSVGRMGPVEAPPPKLYDRGILGRLGEALYASENPSSTWVAKTNPNATWDFTDPDGTLVNVRARRPAKDRPRWTFLRASEACTASVYHFYGFDASGRQVLLALRVPAEALPTKGFSVDLNSKTSKWLRYQIDGYPKALEVKADELESIHLELWGVSRDSLDKMTTAEREGLVDRALRYYRLYGFPYPAIPSDAQLQREVGKVLQYAPQDRLLPISQDGLRSCTGYMPGRFSICNATADFSAVGAFEDDDRLRRALRFCLRGKSPSLRPSRVRNSLTALNRTPVQFRPAVAAALVQEYAPEAGTIFDPCAGWGGRMFGAMVRGHQYVGVEPVASTADGLSLLGERLQGLGYGSCHILRCGIEEADLEGVQATFALTSPPYVGQEEYEDLRWRTFEAWREEFLPAMFAQTRKVLVLGGRFAVSIRDVQYQGKTLPLEASTLEVGAAQGFVLEDTWRMSLASFGNQNAGRWEPVYIFRKTR